MECQNTNDLYTNSQLSQLHSTMHHRACYPVQEVSVTLQPESCPEHFACVERRVRITMACTASLWCRHG